MLEEGDTKYTGAGAPEMRLEPQAVGPRTWNVLTYSTNERYLGMDLELVTHWPNSAVSQA